MEDFIACSIFLVLNARTPLRGFSLGSFNPVILEAPYDSNNNNFVYQRLKIIRLSELLQNCNLFN